MKIWCQYCGLVCGSGYLLLRYPILYIVMGFMRMEIAGAGYAR